jgi:hypothetical protein
MPIGYLIPIALFAWCTYFVLVPPGWPRALRTLQLSFDVVSELPFIVLFMLANKQRYCFVSGDIGTPAGQAVFGLAILTALGQIVTINRGLGSAPLSRKPSTLGW